MVRLLGGAWLILGMIASCFSQSSAQQITVASAKLFLRKDWTIQSSAQV